MTLKDESNDKIEYVNSRENVRISYKLMTKAIDEVSDSTKPYNYSNAVNMIYRIVLGFDAKGFRKSYGLTENADIPDNLTNEQLQAIDKLQIENTKLLYDGMESQDRKDRLKYIYDNFVYQIISTDINFDEIKESGN